MCSDFNPYRILCFMRVYYVMVSTPFHHILQFQQDEKRSDARRASAGLALVGVASERKNADGRLSSCPEGAAQIRPCGVAVLDKGEAIAYGLRLALTYLSGSENAK
jgi:hypothetical protein